MTSLFCFGMGYIATALSKAIIAEGGRAAGTSRSEAKKNTLEKEGIECFLFPDRDDEKKIIEYIENCQFIIFSIPPGPEGDPVLNKMADALGKKIDGKWGGYLSTTGVYGDRKGGWVDEKSACRPATERGKRRLAAEEAHKKWAENNGMALSIFRLAGIYGPGRNALISLKKGRSQMVEKSGQIFSRIHRDDAVAGVKSAMEKRVENRIYNLCDDNPSPPQDVIRYAAKLSDVPLPKPVSFEKAELSDMARSFYAENKRVRNNRIKQELGITLKWPDYKTALDALWAEIKITG